MVGQNDSSRKSITQQKVIYDTALKYYEGNKYHERPTEGPTEIIHSEKSIEPVVEGLHNLINPFNIEDKKVCIVFHKVCSCLRMYKKIY